jgi:hypothetical protein
VQNGGESGARLNNIEIVAKYMMSQLETKKNDVFHTVIQVEYFIVLDDDDDDGPGFERPATGTADLGG